MKLKVIKYEDRKVRNEVPIGSIITVVEIDNCCNRNNMCNTSHICKTSPMSFYFTVDGEDKEDGEGPDRYAACYWEYETLDGRKVTNKGN
jgi:hypothetical protein